MKFIVVMLAMVTILATGCGKTEDSSVEQGNAVQSSSQKSDESQTNIEYVIRYPAKNTEYEQLVISEENSEELNSLVDDVMTYKNEEPEYSYSKKEEKEGGSAGGLVIYLDKIKDGELEYTLNLSGYSLALNDEHEDADFGVDYPDEDNVDVFACDESDALINLCKSVSNNLESVENALYS